MVHTTHAKCFCNGKLENYRCLYELLFTHEFRPWLKNRREFLKLWTLMFSWMFSIMFVQELVRTTPLVYLAFSSIQFSIDFYIDTVYIYSENCIFFSCEWNLSTSCRRLCWLSASLYSARKLPALKFSTNQMARQQRNNEPSSYVTLDPEQHGKLTRFCVVYGLNAFFGLFSALLRLLSLHHGSLY